MNIDWLYKEEIYSPKKDNQKFLDKSILSFIHLLSTLKREGVVNNPISYNVSSMLKMVFTLCILIFISLSRSFIFIGLILIYNFSLILMFEKDEKRGILFLCTLIPTFTLIALIPSMMMGNIRNSLLIIIKVFCTISSVNLLSYTTKWSHITKSLKLFFIPDLFIFILEITIKYIFILGDFSLQMLYSLKLRSVGKDNNKHTSISRIVGNTFIKSKNLGEEMFSAMECRGFTGEYKSFMDFKLHRWDIPYIIVNIILIVSFFLLKYKFPYTI
ncbi:energy-coupling factor transporter transmembrane component T family protein [Clostridium sp. DL1XJH146]